ncbi:MULTISPECIES: hypothetical protein [Stenotrophomonas]|uniref:hypothetical protein n=1 Tax=Stenotrophomonas TaxID=40323 RepID=UPI0021599075|nr:MULTISPECIES: hypothetical protein [Stenotrophomonas]
MNSSTVSAGPAATGLAFTRLGRDLEWYKAEHPTTHGKAKSEVRLFIARFGHRPIDTLRPMEMES